MTCKKNKTIIYYMHTDFQQKVQKKNEQAKQKYFSAHYNGELLKIYRLQRVARTTIEY